MRLHYTKAMALVDADFSPTVEGAFSGYAAATGNVDLGNDIILKGAFEDFLKNAKPERVRVLWQHRQDMPIGKSIFMREDDNGLAVEGELLLDIDKAKEARTLIKNNAIDGLSIGYTVDDYTYDNQTRIIKKLTVHEYSFVTFAMNPSAIVNDIKSCKLDSIRDIEHYLRDVCMLSRSDAKTLISRIKTVRDESEDFNEIAASLMKLNKTLRG